MKPGAVIVDVAVDQGGCIETTRETTHDDPVYEAHGVVHYAVGNMPGAVPHTSTYALTNATLAVHPGGRRARRRRGRPPRPARSPSASTPSPAPSPTKPVAEFLGSRLRRSPDRPLRLTAPAAPAAIWSLCVSEASDAMSDPRPWCAHRYRGGRRAPARTLRASRSIHRTGPATATAGGATMSEFDHRITSWMRDHHAVVSIGVLTGAGVSETQRRRLVEHGVLERVVDGAYRFRGVPDDELSRCVALCSSRSRLVVAGLDRRADLGHSAKSARPARARLGCATWPRSTASRSSRGAPFASTSPCPPCAGPSRSTSTRNIARSRARRATTGAIGATSTRLAHRACRRGRVAPRLRSGDR